MAEKDWQGAISQIVKGISQMIDNKISKTTKIYSGQVLSKNADGSYNVKYNGQTHAIMPYKMTDSETGIIVKVFVPQGNQNLAFFI